MLVHIIAYEGIPEAEKAFFPLLVFC